MYAYFPAGGGRRMVISVEIPIMPNQSLMIANTLSVTPVRLDLCPGRLIEAPAEGVSAPVTLAPDSDETFAERFCCHFDVPAETFETEILRRTLYPHARWLNLFAPWDFFLPDRTFVSSVGRLTRRHDFDGEAKDFQGDRCNECFLRRCCRLRVTVGPHAEAV